MGHRSPCHTMPFGSSVFLGIRGTVFPKPVVGRPSRLESLGVSLRTLYRQLADAGPCVLVVEAPLFGGFGGV